MLIVEFDLIATIMTIVLLYLFHARKKTTDETNRRFTYLAWACLGSAVFGAASTLVINYTHTQGLIAISLSSIRFLFYFSVPALAVFYTMTVALRWPEQRIPRFALIVPWLVSVLLILTNPWTNWVVYIDIYNTVREGAGLIAIRALAMVYLVIILALALSKKSSLSLVQRLSFLSVLVFPVLAFVIQIFHPVFALDGFAASFTLLFVLLSIQDTGLLIDGGTGLYNREAFLVYLRQTFKKKRIFSVIIVHAPEFANLPEFIDNRALSCATRQFSGWLSTTAGKGAICCSLEDGLFALIIPADKADNAAESILDKSGNVWNCDGINLEIPFRLAVLYCPSEAENTAEVLDRIEQLAAMPAQIGAHRRIPTSSFTPGKQQRSAAISFALRGLLSGHDLCIRYQPVYSLSDKKIIALEALLGLRLDDGEWVGQSEILAIAERLGLARDLSALYFEQACMWYASSGVAAKGVRNLELRLVPARCMEPGWPDAMLLGLHAAGMKAENLCLELTETAVANLGGNIEKDMLYLTEKGVAFALDDYGSGYTDLGRILHLPFRSIKLDKRIVQAGLSDKKGRKLLDGSIALFSHLGHAIVAEGVETAEQALSLSSMGCGYLQGYYFGGPMEAKAILARLG